MQKVLPHIIDEAQNALVKGRLITEVFHWLKQ